MASWKRRLLCSVRKEWMWNSVDKEGVQQQDRNKRLLGWTKGTLFGADLNPLCFSEDLKKYGATTVVRVCEVTYDKTPLEKDGITVMDWPFDDGAPPPGKIVEDWLNLLKTKFFEDPGSCVAVHCVAGLGRAPVLVALALIESGMKYEDAIQFIRQKRRGAINSKQLTYLEKYRPKQRLRFKDPHNHKNKCCIM
ncbi:protein tyrosine phosphatase type IVA 3 isoform X2 [Notamacropus eugenii]|uniref:protein tyrosine phosphatase type IVA 3 isoform X2 n=1 Tax=Notamacropus eugenii TaxID=9315 RepID=UPI003B67A905